MVEESGKRVNRELPNQTLNEKNNKEIRGQRLYIQRFKEGLRSERAHGHKTSKHNRNSGNKIHQCIWVEENSKDTKQSKKFSGTRTTLIKQSL